MTCQCNHESWHGTENYTPVTQLQKERNSNDVKSYNNSWQMPCLVCKSE